LIDIISFLPVLLFNLCFTFTSNHRIVMYVKRVRALRMSDMATVLKIKKDFACFLDVFGYNMYRTNGLLIVNSS